MALRVLLADESTTIKKVMQLALQDFAVEVKAVHVGVDVVEVAKVFRPDIIFADVLLQKKNGYEVCSDIKKEPSLQPVPVVLMWSSFLDIDEKLASQCGANQRLEKPFDVETLRQLILELVPKTRSQRLAHFLKFPETITEPLQHEQIEQREQQTRSISSKPASNEDPAVQRSVVSPPPQAKQKSAIPHVQQVPVAPPAIQHREHPAESNWNMESFDEIENFVELTGLRDVAAQEPIRDGTVEHEPVGLLGTEDENDHASHSGQEDNDGDQDGVQDEETFSQFRLSDLSSTVEAAPASKPAVVNRQVEAPKQVERSASYTPTRTAATTAPKADSPSAKPRRAEPEATRPESVKNRAEDSSYDEESWSHQDLTAFKIDLEPVPVEGADFALTFDVDDREIEGTSYLHQNEGAQELELHSSRDAISYEQHHEIRYQEDHSPASLELDDDDVDSPQTHDVKHSGDHEADFAISDLGDHSLTSTSGPASGSGSAPALTEEQLERIIRAQSREMIESVVKKIVPDIAIDLIKRELKRLLSENLENEKTAAPSGANRRDPRR